MDKVTAYNYKEYVENKKSLCRNIPSKHREKLAEIEYNRLLKCSYPYKYHHFATLIALIIVDDFLSSQYTINEDAYYWEDKIYIKQEKKTSDLPICYDTSNQNFSGLYFIGATYFVPTTMKHFYAVKIGVSYENIGKRISQYGTANPFIYHEKEHVLPFSLFPHANEETCHKFLKRISIQKIAKNTEWYIVDEKTYFYLCEKMKDHDFFNAIATGRIREI